MNQHPSQHPHAYGQRNRHQSGEPDYSRQRGGEPYQNRNWQDDASGRDERYGQRDYNQRDQREQYAGGDTNFREDVGGYDSGGSGRWPRNEDRENYGGRQEYSPGGGYDDFPDQQRGRQQGRGYGNRAPYAGDNPRYNSPYPGGSQQGGYIDQYESRQYGGGQQDYSGAMRRPPQQSQGYAQPDRGGQFAPSYQPLEQPGGGQGSDYWLSTNWNSSSGGLGFQQHEFGNYRGRAPKGWARSDERIKEDICERLSEDPQIDASDISVSVQSGVVTLEGNIENRRQKYRVEDLSDACSGVKDVQNRLTIARGERSDSTGQQPASSRSGGAGTLQSGGSTKKQ